MLYLRWFRLLLFLSWSEHKYLQLPRFLRLMELVASAFKHNHMFSFALRHRKK